MEQTMAFGTLSKILIQLTQFTMQELNIVFIICVYYTTQSLIQILNLKLKVIGIIIQLIILSKSLELLITFMEQIGLILVFILQTINKVLISSAIVFKIIIMKQFMVIFTLKNVLIFIILII